MGSFPDVLDFEPVAGCAAVAEQLGWTRAVEAEYIALTMLQGDALVALDQERAAVAADLVEVAPLERLTEVSSR